MRSSLREDGEAIRNLSADERKQYFSLRADEEAIKRNYKSQIDEYERENLNRELGAGGGTRPAQVHWANLPSGLVSVLLGLAVLYAHFEMGKWALEPFGMGELRKFVAFCLAASGAAGAAVLLTGILKVFVQQMHDAHNVSIMFAGGLMLVISATCSATLGELRAERILVEAGGAERPVIIQGEKVGETGIPEKISRFYESSGRHLGFLFPAMAVAFDVASGVLIHVGFGKLVASLSALFLLRRKRKLDMQKVADAGEVDTAQVRAERESLEFTGYVRAEEERERRRAESRAKQYAYRHSPEYRNRRIGLILACFIAALLGFMVLASSGYCATVVGIDMSLSEAKPSVTGVDPFQAKKKAVDWIIDGLGPGERFHVVGITGRSRMDPWIILSARLGEKPGFFSENLLRDRAIVKASWKKSAEKLKPFSKKTDILGFLFLAAELLAGAQDKKLYVLSDGMNCTDQLNLEKPPSEPSEFAAKLKKGSFPDLKGVRVTWLGMGGPGISDMHLKALELNWREFLQSSGAEIKQLTTLKEVLK
jgi:hypothetical protein